MHATSEREGFRSHCCMSVRPAEVTLNVYLLAVIGSTSSTSVKCVRQQCRIEGRVFGGFKENWGSHSNLLPKVASWACDRGRSHDARRPKAFGRHVDSQEGALQLLSASVPKERSRAGFLQLDMSKLKRTLHPRGRAR
jgi:hypothetical protein